MIDSTINETTNPKLLAQQIKQFEYAINIMPDEMVMLILLNKQDLTDQHPMTAEQFAQQYPVHLLHDRTVAFIPTSAKFGHGVDSALNWFVDAFTEQ